MKMTVEEAWAAYDAAITAANTTEMDDTRTELTRFDNRAAPLRIKIADAEALVEVARKDLADAILGDDAEPTAQDVVDAVKAMNDEAADNPDAERILFDGSQEEGNIGTVTLAGDYVPNGATE